MTSAQAGDEPKLEMELTDFVPELGRDFVRRDLGAQSVVWSPFAAEPTALDPIATVMLDVVDGEASAADLATDVHEEIGIPLETAQRQVARVVELYARAGLLSVSTG